MSEPQFSSLGGAGGRRRPGSKKKGQRLPALDHVRALNAQAPGGGGGKGQKRIFQKRDLVEAVRRMSPVKASGDSEEGKVRFLTTEGPMADGMDSTTKALVDLEDGVNASARRFNDLKMAADLKTAELRRLQDQLRDLEAENSALEQISAKKTREAVRIEKLKEEIAAVSQRMDKKDFQKQQLEHMAKRLKTNQINFDAHIKSMDAGLRASKKEYDEVKNLMRQLESSKQQAVQGLHKYQMQLERARKERERELADRQAEAANAKRMEEWRKEREKVRQEMAAELRGDMSKDQEQALLKQLQEREGESEQLRAATKERQQKALTLEEAFAQIKQATGVTSLEEMVEKFMGQGANKAALEEEKAEAEARLAKYKTLKEEAETEFAEMKASGIGGTELSREIYDRMDDEIQQAKNALKVNKASCDRLESVLVAVRQGAVGLAQRLAPFNSVPGLETLPPLNVDADSTAVPNAAGASGSGDGDKGGEGGGATMELLHRCELRLVKILEIMSGAGASPPGGMTARSGAADHRGPGAGRPETEDQRAWTPFANTDPVLHKNNVRVTPAVRVKDIDHMEPTPRSDDDDDGDDEDADGDAMPMRTREEMKDIAKSRYQRRIRERELAARREANKAKNQDANIQKSEKKHARSRLTASREATPSLTFLTQKPDLL